MNSIHTGKIKKPTETSIALNDASAWHKRIRTHLGVSMERTMMMPRTANVYVYVNNVHVLQYISYVFRLLLLPFLSLLMFHFLFPARSLVRLLVQSQASEYGECGKPICRLASYERRKKLHIFSVVRACMYNNNGDDDNKNMKTTMK